MMQKCVEFVFNQKKAIESILYLATRIPAPDVYGICKLLYLADKMRLERYGSFVFGETYCAMEQGATPSNAYDLLKAVTKGQIEGLKRDGNKIIASRKPDLEYLSKADIECLDSVINTYGKLPNLGKRKYAYDEAWNEAWNKRGSSKSVPMPVASIAKYLANSDELVDYLCSDP